MRHGESFLTYDTRHRKGQRQSSGVRAKFLQKAHRKFTLTPVSYRCYVQQKQITSLSHFMNFSASVLPYFWHDH